MGISLEHLELFVPADRRNLSNVESLLEQATNSFVAQIVEVKIVHLSTNAQMLERKAD